MSAIIVIGSQWGDEGKGKAVDVFSAPADYVVRYQGGANAGHTLNIGGKQKILHLIPSGVFHSNTTCVISPGVVLDIETLLSEIQAIKKSGPWLNNPGKLLISDSATVLLNYHKTLDQAREKHAEGKNHGEKIGTTGKGVGPAYEDRAGRKALLFGDLFEEENTLKHKLSAGFSEKKFLIEHFYKANFVSLEDTLNEILKIREELKSYREADTSAVIYKALKENKKVLFEGAQGSLLDLLHGTYPYVTGSSTLAGFALAGTGIGPGGIKKVVGITKAYTTRVGEGPFPTECKDEQGEFLQKKGGEWGASTGRKRRCGWLDLPALKYAVRLNGLSSLALMKLDVLSQLKEIPVCTAYNLNGKKITDYLVHSSKLNLCEPVYEVLPGWEQDISNVKSFEDLPKTAQDYVLFVEKATAVPVDVISVGPGREQTITRHPLF